MTKPKVYKNEGDVKAEVKRVLKAMDFYYWMPAANGYGTQGVSDFLAIKDGVFFAIETKYGYNKPTVHQIRFIQEIRNKKGVAFWIDEREVHDLQAILEDELLRVKTSRLLRES